MGNKDIQRKYSLRKFKGVGLASAVVGLFFANGSVYANVTSNGTNEPTIVSDTTKVESTKATTFTDDTDASKTFKVDAVLDGGVTEPTKANINTGDTDGNDTVNFKSGATVNYKLDSDKSLLKTETVEASTGTVTTPYDKKGLAADTDGKDYRESTVAKTGDAVTAATGKKDTVEANNKVYEYVRSEVEGTDKPKYNKTNFNNIEVAVSPEGMHNKLGEIDYTKTKGKVYLVEETADGQYGKFVEANGVTSDEDAVEKWKAGEASAKEFTKENVTLQEGDTVLVLDKDTYAVTKTVERKSKKTGTSVTYVAVKENIYDGTSTDFYGLTYAILRENYTAIKDIGDDNVFGTADDNERNATSNGAQTSKSMDVFDVSGREDKNSKYLQKTPDLNTSNATVKDILKDVFATGYRVIDFFTSNAEKPTDIEAINTVKTNLDNKVDELVNYMKDNNIRVGLSNGKVGFYVNDTSADNDSSKLDQFETKVREVSTVLDALPIIDKVKHGEASKEEAGKYGAHDSDVVSVSKDIVETYEFTTVGGLVVTTNTKYDRDSGSAIIWNKYPVNTEGNINISNVTTNGTWGVTVADDKSQATLTKSGREVKEWEPSDETTTDTATVTKKEIITPIRAYKVMGEEKPVVTHYYNLKITEDSTPTLTEIKGSVVVKYVDADGKEIKDSEKAVIDAVLRRTETYTRKSGETVLEPRIQVTENDVNYNAAEKKVDTITKDGKKYVFRGVYAVSDKFNNTTEETGKVKEGTTTVVYQYDYVIPVDPTKPNEGENTPPKPEDKIPNDPKGRTYKDLGLLTEVKRNITYVYENGPKAEQEASAPVEQKARFTRTAEINSRTGEVTYTTDWTPEQKLAEVVSPKIDKYAVNKEKVAELPVTHESEDSSEIVKYRENPEIIEHDAEKDKKGSVVVKYVDAQGNEIDTAVTVKDNVVVEKATTKVYADREETTYTATNEEYSTVASRKDVIEANGKKYSFRGAYEVSDKYNNVLEETGKVKEGTTTVVYQYDYVIPVDPTKPNEGEQNPPKPEDKIPNDPKGRTYKDLGLLTEVKRDITYVYENGPKAGQEASAPVNQSARFTRTAEINSRTGEVTYTTDWTPEQKLVEVVSPEIKDYTVDKAKVDELTVTHESKDSAVVVKYSQNKPNSVRDYAKDKKGTVVVKFVDINENFLADDVVTKNNVIVAEATTTTTGDKEETTYKATGEEYAVTAPETIEVDGVTFRLKRVLPAGDKFNNTVEEKGLVKEGVTTIVYQYVMQIDAPKVEVLEFEGGVVPLDPPVVDIPELKIPEEPKPEPNPVPTPTPQPAPTPQRNETPKPLVPVTEDSETPEVPNKPVPTNYNPDGNTYPAPSTEVTQLPNTGTESNTAFAAFGFVGILSGLSIVLRKKDSE